MEVDLMLEYSCEQFQGMLINSGAFFDPNTGILRSADHPMAAPHPSPAVLAQFASDIYTEMENNEHVVYECKLKLLNDWKLLTTARNSDRNNGYFGAAFWSSSLQQVVLVHRGTVPSDLGAMWTNLRGIVFKNYSRRMSSAATFADRMKDAIREANEQPGKRFQLSITGHSLGGWLAQVCGFSAKYLRAQDGRFVKTRDLRNGIHAHVVAFDSPGCRDMLEEIVDSCDFRYRRTVSLEALDVSSYLSAPNMINTFGLHVGSIYRVMVDVSTFNALEKNITYTLTTHKIENFVKAFADGRSIYEMKDWPVKLFTEYKSFHQKVTNADEYHLDPNDCDERSMEIRYKAEESDNSVGLRIFSDDELKLLSFWIVFKNVSVKINKIQEFFTEHNLGSWSDLFGDFSLDIKNHTITCDSKETLEVVIKRTKLLVRWFPVELMAAVDQQSREVPKIIYSMAIQNYLDSLPECIWDFTDSIGLRHFLQSDHRILQMKSEDCDLEVLRLISVSRRLREPSSHLDKYVTLGSQTFLRWTDIVNLELAIDIENLPDSGFTHDNLLVIDCASTDIPETYMGGKIFKHFLDNINKKLILVSDYQKPDLKSFMSFPVVVRQLEHFESNQLTEDSKKKLFMRKMLDIGDKIMSLADFVGENNFNNFSSNITNLIDRRYFKNILRNKNFSMKIENSCPNVIEFGVNISTINRKLSVQSVARRARSGDLLVISGDRLEKLTKNLVEANLGAGNRVIWVQENVLAGESKFKETVLKNLNEKVYWIQANHSSTDTTVKQMYHKTFYMRRRFLQVTFTLERFAARNKGEDIFIFLGIPSKESLASLIRLSQTERDIFIENESILAITSHEEANDIVNKHYGKPVHLLRLEENGGRILWQRSLGSLEGLRSYMRRDPDRAVDEGDLHKLDRKALIIADEPGMGKSTSLASMARLLGSDPANWVIWIQLKHFQIPFGQLPIEPRRRCEVLLGGSLTGDSFPTGLLQFCLHHKHTRQVYLMLDGFDEIKIDHASRSDAKNEVLRLLEYLNNETTAIIWVTTRLHDRELLENALATFAVTFENIEERQQREYLENFWSSHLLLEDSGDAVRSKLEECATYLYTEAKKHLGSGIRSFMGVPLQMRMLAEVFLQQIDDYVISQSDIGKAFEVESAFSLYEKFIKVKYNIYFKAKTGLTDEVGGDLYEIIVAYFTETHRILGVRTLFPDFAKEYHGDFESRLGVVELSRIGLVHSGGHGTGDIEFIHRTLAEYFCADYIVRRLTEKDFCRERTPAVQLLLTDILLRDSNKIIRMFINNFLLIHSIAESVQDSVALQVEKLWQDKQHLLFDVRQQTALHLAVVESNEGIIDFLIGSLKSEPAQKAFVGFVAAHDGRGDTALGLASRKAEEELSDKIVCKKIMEKLVRSIDSCPYEIKLEILLASYMKGPPSILLGKYLQDDFVCLETNTAFIRTQKITTEVAPSFLAAVEECREKYVEMLFDKMENDTERHYVLCTPNFFGKTALHIAAQARKKNDTKNGHLPVVKFLIEKGADINSADKEGRTTLHIAAEEGNLPIVSFLVKNGADISAADKDGRSALHIAAAEGYLPVVKFLINTGKDSSYKNDLTVLHTAVVEGHLSVVKYLVRMGAIINSEEKHGRTALSAASKLGHLPVVTFLVESGANFDYINKHGRSALHMAAEFGQLPVVEFLVNKGADVNLSGKHGRSALHTAAEYGYLPVVKFLIEKGADINCASKFGGTALSMAIACGHLPVVKFLIEKGADFNSVEEDGRTALSIATRRGHLPVVAYLEVIKRK